MAHEFRSAAIIAASNLVLVVGSAAISVYGLDQYDQSWGRDRSWQALSWLAVASSVLAFFGALFGSIIASRSDRSLHPAYAVLAGGLTTVLLLTLLYLKREFALEGGLFGAVLGSMLLPFVVCVAMSRPADPA